MIKPEQIRELLRAQPFKPFRLCLSDGTSYDITNHDIAIVEKTTVDIGMNPDPNGIVDRLVRCALLHIVKIEDLQPV
jgi:hypothetical protein